MILNPFSLRLGPRLFTFVDRMAIDSPIEHQAVQTLIAEALMVSQQDAMCAALGVTETEAIPNFGLGVYENGTRVGIYLMAANRYISGPWEDVIDWVQTSNDPATIHGRHMPMFLGLDADTEKELAAETAWWCLTNRWGA